jgi:hypothetical protein
MSVEWVDDELGPSGDDPRGGHRSRRRSVPTLWLAGGLLVVGVVVGAIVGRVTAPDRTGQPATELRVSGYVITSSFSTIAGGPGATEAPWCVGEGAADGVHDGTPFVISDRHAHVLGAAFLGAGRPTTDGRGCTFPFHLRIADAGNWYLIQVGERPAPAVERSELGALRVDLG